jgi:probable F420-dependent oxidoreductase
VGSHKVLIVNADDFGQSLGINNGVIRAHEEGIVTSATLMVRWPAAPHAAEYARSRTNLSVGLHLDLAEWAYEMDDQRWFKRYEVAPADDESAVSAEIERQLDLFVWLLGRPPTHLDSHQHVHLAEPVSKLLLRAGRRLGVPVRHLMPGPIYNGSFYGQDNRGFPHPEAISVDSLIRIIEGLPTGVTELACHPGANSDLETAYGSERVTEVATLCSPNVRATLNKNGVELSSFEDLTGSSLFHRFPSVHASPTRQRATVTEKARWPPFRFGASAHQAPSADAWRRLGRKLEDLGFSTLLVPDHLGDQLSPVPALATAAESTSTLRLGVLVSCNDFRHPAVYAKELATLDVLSGGRVEWGMGAGWLETDFKSAGIPFDPPGVRVDRLQEAVAVMKGLFGDGPVTHEGKQYQISGLNGSPKPLQRPHPPLLIAGAGRRMLSFAAQSADIVGIAPSWSSRRIGSIEPTKTVVGAADDQFAWIREGAGDRLRDIEINMNAYPAIVTADREGRAGTVADPLGLDPAQVLASPHLWLGTIDQLCESLLERRERWGVSYWVVPAPAIDAVAPVIGRLAGR